MFLLLQMRDYAGTKVLDATCFLSQSAHDGDSAGVCDCWQM